MYPILRNCVARKEPITIEILFKLVTQFDFNNHLHVCMRTLFLVAFCSFFRVQCVQFSYVRVPYKFFDIVDTQACNLCTR